MPRNLRGEDLSLDELEKQLQMLQKAEGDPEIGPRAIDQLEEDIKKAKAKPKDNSKFIL